MSNKQFIITAEQDDITAIAEMVNNERRFLSDSPNIESFRWYPLSDSGLQAIEIELIEGADLNTEEIALLTEHYASMDIGVLNDDNSISAFISNGEVEVVD